MFTLRTDRTSYSGALSLILVFLLSVFWQEPAYGGDEQFVPVNVQIPLILKIMTFDRHFNANPGNRVIIGIIYQSNVRSSVNIKDEFVREITRSAAKDIRGTPVTCVPLDISGEMSLAESVLQEHVRLLYVTPLRSVSLQSILAVSRVYQIPTLSAVGEYVESGLSVGLVANGPRAQILINLPASREEGIEFSSQLLKLARVIQ